MACATNDFCNYPFGWESFFVVWRTPFAARLFVYPCKFFYFSSILNESKILRSMHSFIFTISWRTSQKLGKNAIHGKLALNQLNPNIQQEQRNFKQMAKSQTGLQNLSRGLVVPICFWDNVVWLPWKFKKSLPLLLTPHFIYFFNFLEVEMWIGIVFIYLLLLFEIKVFIWVRCCRFPLLTSFYIFIFLL